MADEQQPAIEVTRRGVRKELWVTAHEVGHPERGTHRLATKRDLMDFGLSFTDDAAEPENVKAT